MLKTISAHRMDCCSKAFHVSGFVWNQLKTARPSDQAINRLKVHHKSLISLSCHSAGQIIFALPLLGQLEHIHIDISSQTLHMVPNMLSMLNKDRLTSLSLHCWDYSNRQEVIAALPRILPQLTRIKLITEPKDESQFLDAVAANCNKLEALHFESERSGLSPESSAAFDKILAANKPTLKFLGAFLIRGSWKAFFPSLDVKDMSPSDSPNAWGWQELTEECQRRYGMPFERFGIHPIHSLRKRTHDFFHTFVEETQVGPKQMSTLWSFYKMYYPKETLSTRFSTALPSLKVFFNRLCHFRRNSPIAPLSSDEAEELVSFVAYAASIAASASQYSKMLGFLVAAFANDHSPKIQQIGKDWILANAERVRDVFLSKVIKSMDLGCKVTVFSDLPFLESIGVDLNRPFVLEKNHKTYSGRLGVILALHCSTIMHLLVKMPSFDPFALQTESGANLFDAIFTKFCDAPTHASDISSQSVAALLKFAVETGKRTLEDLETMCARLINTCIPPAHDQLSGNTYYVRIRWVDAFLSLLPNETIQKLMQAHYKATLDCDFVDEDISQVSSDLFSSFGMTAAVAKLLWKDLLRKLKTTFSEPSAIQARLTIIKYHDASYPAFVDDFLEAKSDYPVAGVISQDEVESVRSSLKAACAQAGMRPPFKFSSFGAFSFPT
jgi:hypothetical protein